MKKARLIKEKDITVAVAELKAHLSKYLKLARSGKEVVITDHKTPVAKILPFHSGLGLISARQPPSRIHRHAALPATGEMDSLSLLMEDRGRR